MDRRMDLLRRDDPVPPCFPFCSDMIGVSVIHFLTPCDRYSAAAVAAIGMKVRESGTDECDGALSRSQVVRVRRSSVLAA